ncbi:MAG: hypothetical protein Q4D30_04565 [Bacteroidales bacterium]|nr:hypothetical protein [Bacteroidales bacterium]
MLKHLLGFVAIALLLGFASCQTKPDYAGQWAEMTAERIVATFTPTAEGYQVEIGWREDGLAQYEVWTMHAVSDDKDALKYENGTYVIRRYEHQGDKNYTEETVYADGTGSFTINSDGQLVWTDDKDPNGEPVIFIRANFSKE